jgi:hypothetical protein
MYFNEFLHEEVVEVAAAEVAVEGCAHHLHAAQQCADTITIVLTQDHAAHTRPSPLTCSY